MGEHRVSAWLDVLWRGRLRVPLANSFLPSAGIQAGREEGAPLLYVQVGGGMRTLLWSSWDRATMS